ncbi:hypothetical protein [Streptomyces sp. NPDC057910]|uniref:hypothetical protein n=1 Tax=Streptomyces sp. NPDC057910 TaxID=3346278 RepID=UPI0036E6BFB8
MQDESDPPRLPWNAPGGNHDFEESAMTSVPPATTEPDGALTGWHSWGIWVADLDGNEVFVENDQRAARRRSILAQIAAARRWRRLALRR